MVKGRSIHMKRHPLFSAGILTLGSMVISGVIVVLATHQRTALVQPFNQPTRQSGQTGQNPDATFLKGGVLQKEMDDARPEVFLELETDQTAPGFSEREFTVPAESVVSITLRNHSVQNHSYNWVLVTPGSETRIQTQA